jgi:CHAD domain-containing protein
LALIEFLRAIAPQPHLRKLRRIYKDQIDSLDELRDTQVMLAEISETLETLPELLPLQKFLQKREKRLLNSAEHDVREFKSSLTTRHVEDVRTELAEPVADADLSAQLLAVVDEACHTVTQRMKLVDPAHPSSIHRVRIAFKKFRYMLEIIFPILPGYSIEHLKSMHNYQNVMGEIQDVEVMLQTLEEYATNHEAYDPQPVKLFYEQRHAELINTYIENMYEFITFWRQTPDQPFPWEAQDKEPI